MPELTTIIAAAGYVGIAGAVFAETGLFFGFFLPGDSLLFTAGILAAQGAFDIVLLTALTTIAAIVGDSVGYWTGMKAGPRIFTRPDSFWFSGERVRDAERFFEKYGPVSIILARFVPLARTFVPVVAGVAQMPYKKFFVYNVVGALAWATAIPILGYFAGNAIPGIERFTLPLVIAVILLSFLPIVYEYLKHRKHGTEK